MALILTLTPLAVWIGLIYYLIKKKTPIFSISTINAIIFFLLPVLAAIIATMLLPLNREFLELLYERGLLFTDKTTQSIFIILSLMFLLLLFSEIFLLKRGVFLSLKKSTKVILLSLTIITFLLLLALFFSFPEIKLKDIPNVIY